jgi:hypothetical protein
MTVPSARTVLLGVVAVIGLVVLVERLVVTDREAIQAVLEEAVEATQEREWPRLRPLLSDAFSWNGLGPDEAVERVESIVGAHRVAFSAAWKEVEPRGDRCEVEVSVTVMPFRLLVPVRVLLGREESGWRIREVRSL